MTEALSPTLQVQPAPRPAASLSASENLSPGILNWPPSATNLSISHMQPRQALLREYVPRRAKYCECADVARERHEDGNGCAAMFPTTLAMATTIPISAGQSPQSAPRR
jgi:hypothetical protein